MAAAEVVAAALLMSCMSMSMTACGAFDEDAAASSSTLRFDEGFSPLFGEANMERSADDRTVRVTLDRHSGSGFISSHYYHHGFFAAAIKLPADHTAGVVVAFYLSNGDVFEKTHDELDFEFLGNRRRHEWKMQTNVYGNGSTDRGREERYLMPFDATADAHRFSILWSPRVTVFYVDGTPIREVPRAAAMAGDYPSKPMALYVTIWDGSTWATDNGKYKVSYKRGPFTAEFSRLVLRGCRAVNHLRRRGVDDQEEEEDDVDDDERCSKSDGDEYGAVAAATITPRKRMAMRLFRQRQMLYTVCYDTNRYPAALPECDVNAAERQKFWEWGESKVVRPRVRPRSGRARRVSATPPRLVSLQQAD